MTVFLVSFWSFNIKHSIRSTYNLPFEGGRAKGRFLRPCHIIMVALHFGSPVNPGHTV